MDALPVKCPYSKYPKFLCRQMFRTHEDAAIHVILAHSAQPILINEKGHYICFYGKDFGRSGCQETFPTQDATMKHLKLDHSNETEPIKCPISENCNPKAYTKEGLRGHVESAHRTAAYRCTWPNCTETFSSRNSVNKHINSDHKGIETKVYYCPVNKCKNEYKSPAGLSYHMETKHPDWHDESKPQPSKRRTRKTSRKPAKTVKLNCPFEGCVGQHNSRNALKYHLESGKHRGKSIPCLFEGCLQRLPTLTSFEKHAKEHDRQSLTYFPCPSETCKKMFMYEDQAQQHYQDWHVDLDNGPVCQTCNETFSTVEQRRLHEQTHTHKFLCSHLHCVQRFETCELAIQHISGTDHDYVGRLYTCPLPKCRVSTVGRGLTKQKIDDHFARHVRLGHVAKGTELVPIQAPAPLPLRRLPLFDTIYTHCAVNSSDQDKPAGQLEVDAMSDELDHKNSDPRGVDNDLLQQYNIDLTDEDMLLEAEYDFGVEEEEKEEDFGELFSEKHRSYILEQNEQYWENHKDRRINLHGRGRICQGPGMGIQDFVLEPCPNRVIIDLDTARIKLRQPENGTRTITLDHECVSCFTMKRTRAFLEQGQANSENSLQKVNLGVLRDLFADAAEKEWTCPPGFQKILERIQDIREGNMPPSSLLIVDTEFSVATRQPWEVAIIEYLSGKTRLNALLEHSHGLLHECDDRDNRGRRRIIQMSKMQAKNIYNPKRKLDRLNVHQVAQRLKEIGTNSDTLFVVWATCTLDLRILRNYLVTGGYSGILPDDEHCIPVCHTFRQNFDKLGNGKQFPLRLEIIFPIFHPGHKLIGTNHEALPDCQQTRHMCLSVLQLSMPVEDRKEQWKPKSIRRPYAGSILNYFPAIQQEQHSDNVLDKPKEKKKSAGKPLKPSMRQTELSFASQAQSGSHEAAPSEAARPARNSKRLELAHK